MSEPYNFSSLNGCQLEGAAVAAEAAEVTHQITGALHAMLPCLASGEMQTLAFTLRLPKQGINTDIAPAYIACNDLVVLELCGRYLMRTVSARTLTEGGLAYIWHGETVDDYGRNHPIVMSALGMPYDVGAYVVSHVAFDYGAVRGTRLQA